MKIIVINGMGGVGKDTFVDCCCRNTSKKIINISTIDPIKELAKQIGWNGNKDNKDRKFLSDLKDLLTEYNNFSFQYVSKQIQANLDSDIIFIHCREPKEIKKIVDGFGAVTLLVKNPRITPITSNHADAEVESYNYDYIINNDKSLISLIRKSAEFLTEIGVLS